LTCCVALTTVRTAVLHCENISQRSNQWYADFWVQMTAEIKIRWGHWIIPSMLTTDFYDFPLSTQKLHGMASILCNILPSCQVSSWTVSHALKNHMETIPW